MTATSSTIKALNERRTDAVRRRLSGESLADVSSAVGLSVPTIVAAMKAYDAGGWEGVAVKRRGRPTATDALSSDRLDELRQNLHSHLLSVTEAPVDADALWSTMRVQNWLASQGVDVSPATVARHARAWDLAPSSPAIAEKAAVGTPRHQFIAAARAAKKRVVWLSAHPTSIRIDDPKDTDHSDNPSKEHKEAQQKELHKDLHKDLHGTHATLLCAHTPRGLGLWLLIKRLDASCVTQFLHAVAEHVGMDIAPITQRQLGIDPSLLAPWQQEVAGEVLILPDAATAIKKTTHSTSTARPTMTAQPTIKTNDETPLLAPKQLTHLQRLEAESIHIMREVVAEADNPVMLYSIGKDSAVMLHLAIKAFYPAPPPFPLLHIDTTWKFQEMYKFRDSIAKDMGFELLVHQNEEGIRQGVSPFTHGSELHTDILKTQGLKQALDKYGFDCAFGGARRDEEKSRAKERVFSFRTSAHRWEPKNQRPELWDLYNARKKKGESLRVFPISNWTELDIWQYIHQQSIPIVPLYFAEERPVVHRDGQLIMVDDDRMPLLEGETPEMKRVRFRTLGCYPLTGAVESNATTLTDIIQEMLLATTSEREGRLIDHDTAASMEKKKQEGYF